MDMPFVFELFTCYRLHLNSLQKSLFTPFFDIESIGGVATLYLWNLYYGLAFIFEGRISPHMESKITHFTSTEFLGISSMTIDNLQLLFEI